MKKLGKLYWDIERFGLTPQKLIQRLFGGHDQKILCNSIPKSGTHLIERTLCKNPKIYRKILPTINDRNVSKYGGYSKVIGSLKKGQMIITHFEYNDELQDAIKQNGVKNLLIIRDPRDVAISRSFFVPDTPDHPHHEVFKKLETKKERIMLSIKGDAAKGIPSLKKRYTNYLKWKDHDTCIIRFEDLIGASGGGTKESQKETIQEIYDYLEIDFDLEKILGSTYSKLSPTFRKGAKNKWLEHSDEEIINELSAELNDVLIEYGYEEKEDWNKILLSGKE
jgi:hypothetical protein